MSQLSLRGQFSQFSGLGAGAGFPDPFNDIASLAMPTNMRSALYWCEHIYSLFGTYAMAMDRVASHFLTDVEVGEGEEDENERWTSCLKEVIGVKAVVKSKFRNVNCYGNSYASLIVPFRRMLRCPKCSFWAPLSEIYNNRTFRFKWSIPEFHATCPACKVGSGYTGAWRVEDKEYDDEKKLRVKVWNPHEIELLHDVYSNDVAYLWRIPEDYKRLIRGGQDGYLYHLERAPMEVIRAVHKNQVYRFHDDVIFHMKEPTLAGIVNRGWGIPRILTHFRQIWYVQVLRRFNEAIALDYIIPFRIITPAPAQGRTAGGMAIDPMSMYHGGDFRAMVMQAIRRRRRDPASIQVLPLPVQFQMFGADANQLAPRDLLDQGMETLLNDAGTPVELYNGSLQLQTAPVALRLFESTWHHLVHDANMFLSWLVRQISQVMGWEWVSVTLKRVTIADDLEKQMIAAQLMMSQQLSASRVLGDLGYNWKSEQKQIADEAKFQAELQARIQEEMAQAGFAQQIAKGQSAGGGGGAAPPAGGGGVASSDPAMAAQQPGPVSQYLSSMSPSTPVTPQDMLAVADSLAQELIGLPEGIKDSELRKLQTSNTLLHDAVKGRMEKLRRDARNSAGNYAVAQMQSQFAGS